MRIIALLALALSMTGCVHIGGDCHEFTIWPAFSTTRGCDAATGSLIKWER